VRLIVAFVFAMVLIVPASTPASAGGTPGLATHADVSDLSAAGKEKAKKRKAPKKEEYLRTAPSEPPAGAKK
jgi:hypothetical protein